MSEFPSIFKIVRFIDLDSTYRRTLYVNKLRSILTILGIIMGVFSIVTIAAISDATTAYMNSSFEKIGINVIMVQYR